MRRFAFAEKYFKEPIIYVMEYPSLEISHKLQGGAEFGFSQLAFNKEGDKLASVGVDPDYMLTVWDWKHDAALLKNKAFAQVKIIPING
jgi:hypothetical protein